MRRVLVAVAALVVLAAPLASAPSEPLAGFDAFVGSAVKDWDVPGLAIAVVKDDQVVFARGYGVRELGKPDPVDTHTLFAIGSTTKAMTAALVAMMVDEKKVAWDAPVATYLPWFQLKDPSVTRELTVRDLLTHRGGLPNADYLWYGQSNSGDEILKRVRLIDPAYPVRSAFVYQNVMYAAAGAVIEAVSGRQWADMVRTRIFEPLGMSDSVTTAAGLAQHPNVASPHDVIGGRVRVIENASVDPVAPAGSVWSSVADMSRWMQFLLDGGRAGGRDGRRLVSEPSFKELFTPQTIAPYDMYPTTRLTRPHWMTYALGWFQQDYRGRAVDFHTGSIDGMVAIHGLIRDENLGVYVLGNLDHAEVRHALMYTVFDRFGTSPARNWNDEFRTLYADLEKEAERERARRDTRRVAGTSPSLSLAQLAGDYTDPLYGDVKVSLDNGVLMLQYGAAYAGRLEHWHYNTFRATWNAAWRRPDLVNFVLDADGQPRSVELLGLRFARKKAAGPGTDK